MSAPPEMMKILREFGGKHTNGQRPSGEPLPYNWRDHVYTAAQLQHRIFPPISYCVPDLIPEGLTIIAGKPKIGKSWMALEICIAVAAARYCLGDRKPIQGAVLYAAMEDNPRRMQRRITKLLATFSVEWPEGLTLANSWRRLDKGGVDDIRDWIEQANNPRLIILDTLAGVKPIRTREGYTEDYESIAALHRLASEKGVSIIVLHHTRKMEADDPVDTVSGTLGLSGCADSVLILSRTPQGTTLYVRGRDIEEAEHALTFDKAGCRWTILGNATDVHRSMERGKILDALLNAAELLGPQQIADCTRMKSDNVRYLLGQMVLAGEVMKAARGLYYHPDRGELSDTPSQPPSQPPQPRKAEKSDLCEMPLHGLHPHNGEKTTQYQDDKTKGNMRTQCEDERQCEDKGQCEAVSDVGASGTVSPQQGENAVLVLHCCVTGTSKQDVRKFKISVGPYAQYERSVEIRWLNPGARTRWWYRNLVPNNIDFCTIEREGSVIYDSRHDVPCDMAEWRSSRDRHMKEWMDQKAEHETFMAKRGQSGVSIDAGYDRNPWQEE